MKRITYWIFSTISALVLLLSYHTSTNSQMEAAAAPSINEVTSGTSAETTTSTSGSGSGGSGSDGKGSSSAASAAASPTSISGSFTGSAVMTRWGLVQVRVSVRDGKITAAQAVQYPNGNPRDAQINSYALPILAQEVVDQQSAKIDMVSGATVTSNGYISSLQSALDQAHL